MRVRSMAGLIPLCACLIFEDEKINNMPGFKKKLEEFVNDHPELAEQV